MILHEHNDITWTQWYYMNTMNYTMILHEHNDITWTQWYHMNTMTSH